LFDTAAPAQNEKPIAPNVDTSMPPRPPLKPRLDLSQKAGVPNTGQPSQADIARTAALQSTRQQAVF
jgi:hypothetical protein